MNYYSKNSPWSSTPINVGGYLDILNKRTLPPEDDDIVYEIQPQYIYRPDLLAYDLYKNPKLWWVFTIRNPDILKDPVFDFLPGTQIYLPKSSRISVFLGI